MPREDIRLSTDTMQNLRGKLLALGLDPQDTTAEELYGALQSRLYKDEQTIRRALSLSNDAQSMDVLARIEQYISVLEVPKQCYALKASVAKRMLKKRLPKIAMKRLGYRSAESMLKHEHVAHLFAAAFLCESDSWRTAFREQYAKLTPSDFESRPMIVSLPQSKRWHELAAGLVLEYRHNIVAFKELGAIVILPLQEKVDGLAVTSLLLALNEMNAIRSYSSYIKLQQVKPAFGSIVQQASGAEPQIAAELAGQHVAWQTIHRYYARFQEAYHPEIFEPHVQPDDLNWRAAEDILADLEPTLRFWRGTEHLTLLDRQGHPVSCNMLDVALSYCNHLSFADRIVHGMRDNLWHELLLRYLNQHNLAQAVKRQLSRNLVEEAVPLAE